MAIEDSAEIGTTSGMTPDPDRLWKPGPSEYVVDPLDYNPELKWPGSMAIYDRMRRSDDQVSANIRAMFQTITGFDWDLVGATDVPTEVMELVRAEIGLIPDDDPRKRRRREGIVFSEHLREALMCIPFGFSVFEQVYSYSPEDERNHIRKLAARAQTTIEKIHVERDGGLVGITQTPPEPTPGDAPIEEGAFIPVDNLVWYVLEREGADWTGVSALRSAYKAWVLKVELEVIAAKIIERNGMGIPVAVVQRNLSAGERAAVDQAMAGFRAGTKAFAVLPEGVAFTIEGVKGSLVDPLPTIKYFNQQISKSMQAMFMDLGHDAGARSLGETMLEAFNATCYAIAQHIAEVFTEHVIRDLVELNYGPNAPYPVLTPGEKPQAPQTPADAPVADPEQETE